MAWSDTIGKLLDFLQKPSALGVVALALIFAFLIYVIPIGATLWMYQSTSQESTRQIVSAIKDLEQTVQQHSSVAYRK